ncbi:MAG: calcium-binding protein [Nostoc sp. DedQUE12a]|nr:calcium-binding protein [Nostoc sp. DedQUE12a]
MANIIGTNGNDTLVGTESADTINGKAGNDIITGDQGDDTLTGGGGKDTFVYNFNNNNIVTITDFGGVGKGTNPTAAIIAQVDTIKVESFSARNMLLTQNGSNLEISFEVQDPTVAADIKTKIILQNFQLENLDNLKASGTRPAIGNILFNEETTITDSFNVLDANSTDTSIGIKNTVTFLNDLDNNITGLDDSDDVINGQGGNDKIDGLSGNDLLRGGAGNDTLIGGVGNDTLIDITGNNSLVGGIGDDTLNIDRSTGHNTLNGGAGNDILSARGSKGNNLLFGGDGNDSLNTAQFPGFKETVASLGNNTLYGGGGDDILNASSPEGNNLLFGDDGNDFLSASGSTGFRRQSYSDDFEFSPSGNNTLNGGVGNDTLRAEYSKGDNLLSGGNGNDYLSTSGDVISFNGGDSFYLTSGNNTLNGGVGSDTLLAGYSTGNNLLSGGDDNDYLSISGYLIKFIDEDNYYYYLTSGNNTLNGGAGNDTLLAEYSTGNNLLSGGDGNDSFFVTNGAKDTIDGGQGYDLLSVDYSNATGGITSTFNPTTNQGSITAGTDQVSYKNIERLNIKGTAYNDKIVGSNGNDTLTGGKGNDTLIGGSGIDTFVFNSFNQGVDKISDFNTTNEVIRVSAAGFGGGLSAGVLKTSQLRIGTSATTTTQRFIYNSTTGGLFFDQDGSAGAFAQVQFGQLSAGLSLTNNNFVVA